MSYVVVVHYRAKPGSERLVEEALGKMIEPSRAEAGNLVYQPCSVDTADGEFVIYEEYVDEAAFDAHRTSAHFAEHLAGVVLPNLEYRHRFEVSPLEER